jgi:FixJ family two-component response regulator
MTIKRDVIAIIDDDPSIRGALSNLLSAYDYCTEVYASAAEFIGAAATTQAACLLVDIQLGAVSGVEMGRHLSAAGYGFPIIFMTGSREEAHRRQALDFGCVAFLRKPFVIAELIGAITTATGSAHGRTIH